MSKRPEVNAQVAGHRSAAALNEALEAIVEAFDNTLSRDGSTPNTLEADLDLNSHDILNGGDVHANKLFVQGVRLTDTTSVPNWEGTWATATPYVVNDLIRQDGSAYICLVAHTSGTFSTDLTNDYWDLFVSKGSAGAGSGDMLASNNLSDLTDAPTARSNLSLGTVATLNTVPLAQGGTGATTAADARTNLGLGGLATLDILDQDDMASNSATRPPSQQSVKAYVDNSLSGWTLVGSSSTISSGTIIFTSLGSYSEIKVVGVGLLASADVYRSLQVSDDNGSSWISLTYLRNGSGTDSYGAVGHSDSGAGAKNPAWHITGFNKTWAVKPIITFFDISSGVTAIQNSNDFNALRIYTSNISGTQTGNITGGTVYVFGKV